MITLPQSITQPRPLTYHPGHLRNMNSRKGLRDQSPTHEVRDTAVSRFRCTSCAQRFFFHSMRMHHHHPQEQMTGYWLRTTNTIRSCPELKAEQSTSTSQKRRPSTEPATLHPAPTSVDDIRNDGAPVSVKASSPHLRVRGVSNSSRFVSHQHALPLTGPP